MITKHFVFISDCTHRPCSPPNFKLYIPVNFFILSHQSTSVRIISLERLFCVYELGDFSFFQLYRDVIDEWHGEWSTQCGDLIHNILWNDYHTKVRLHLHPLECYIFFCSKTCKMNSLSKFQIHNIALCCTLNPQNSFTL